MNRRAWGLMLCLVGWGLPFVVLAYHPQGPTDWNYFELASRSLIGFRDAHGHQYTGGLHLYVDYPYLQFGAPSALALLPVQWLPYSLSCWVMLVAMLAAVALATTWISQAMDASPRAALLGGLVVMPPMAYYLVGTWRHLDDVLALLAVAAALKAVRDGRTLLVGVCLGTAASAKPWAVVAAPVLLALARDQRARSALALFASAALWWAPFVIAAPGTVHALSTFSMPVQPGSGLWALGAHDLVPTWLRTTQLELGIGVAAFVALRRDWRAALLAGLAVRMALDPYTFTYYGAGPLLAALAADTAHGRRGGRHLVLALAVFYGVPWAFGEASDAAGVSKLLWAAGTLVLICRPSVARYRLQALRPKPAVP